MNILVDTLPWNNVTFFVCRITSNSLDDNQKSGTASHGTAYKSIISNYYTNDPYFGPSKPKYASKDEALQRLKSIITQSKRSSVTGKVPLFLLCQIISVECPTNLNLAPLLSIVVYALNFFLASIWFSFIYTPIDGVRFLYRTQRHLLN